MDTVLTLYEELNRAGVKCYCWDLGNLPAVLVEMEGQYGLFVDFSNLPTQAEEMVVIAHEAGHVWTGSTHAPASPYDLVAKHEEQADKWAIRRLIPKEELDAAVQAGLKESWELAEHFHVTEDFLKKAVCYYCNGNLETQWYYGK